MNRFDASSFEALFIIMHYYVKYALVGIVAFALGYFVKSGMQLSTVGNSSDPLAGSLSSVVANGQRGEEYRSSQREASLNQQRVSSSAILEALDPAHAKSVRNYLEEQFFTDMFSRIAYQNPEKASQILKEHVSVNAENYQELNFEVIRGWSSNDPAAAYEWLSQQRGIMAPNDFEAASGYTLSALAAIDPISAASKLNELDNPSTKSEVAISIAKNWGKQDPQVAFDWLEGIAPGALSDDALTNCYKLVMRGYISQSPEEAFNFVTKIESSSMRKSLVGDAVTELASKDFAAAAGLVETLTDTPTRKSALIGLLKNADSQTTVQLLSLLVADSSMLESDPLFAEKSLDLLVRTGREAVKENIYSLPPRSQSIASYQVALSILQEGEVEALENWVSNLSTDAALAGGIEVIANHHLKESPDLALQWLGRIKDLESRKKSVSDAILTAEPEDLLHMQEALSSSSFTAEEQSIYHSAIQSILVEKIPSLVLP